MYDLCDCLTLYWMTNTARTSIRAYHGNSFTLPPLGEITVPTAIAAFPRDVLSVPREWAEKHFPVVQYTEMQRGGTLPLWSSRRRLQRMSRDLWKG